MPISSFDLLKAVVFLIIALGASVGMIIEFIKYINKLRERRRHKSDPPSS